MSPLRLNGSTSGYSQLDAPAIAGDQTFTLPGTGGTIDRLNRAGNILQVVNNSGTTTTTNSTVTYSSLITASITPLSTSNNILVCCHATLGITASASAYGQIAIFRGTTSGTLLLEPLGGLGTASTNYQSLTGLHLDNPSTTSSQTYTLALRKGSSGTSSVTTDGFRYTITLMEIAA